MFDDWDFATRFRDVITSIAGAHIERMRPDARYATVVTIDRVNRKCAVRFPGASEINDVTIAMGSIQPAKVGQTVRVAGTLGDRFIDDVMGEAVIAGGTPIGAVITWPATTLPAGYIAANGAFVEPATYPGLFAVYGTSLGQQGTAFRLPTVAGAIIRAA